MSSQEALLLACRRHLPNQKNVKLWTVSPTACTGQQILQFFLSRHIIVHEKPSLSAAEFLKCLTGTLCRIARTRKVQGGTKLGKAFKYVVAFSCVNNPAYLQII